MVLAALASTRHERASQVSLCWVELISGNYAGCDVQYSGSRQEIAAIKAFRSQTDAMCEGSLIISKRTLRCARNSSS